MISETDILDAVAFDEEVRTELLVIYDHLDWNNEAEHLYLLQEKINSYLIFIQDGQLDLPQEQKKYLDYTNRIVIWIWFKHHPSKECLRFLNKTQRTINSAKSLAAKYLVGDAAIKRANRLENVEINYLVHDPETDPELSSEQVKALYQKPGYRRKR